MIPATFADTTPGETKGGGDSALKVFRRQDVPAEKQPAMICLQSLRFTSTNERGILETFNTASTTFRGTFPLDLHINTDILGSASVYAVDSHNPLCNRTMALLLSDCAFTDLPPVIGGLPTLQ